MTTPTLLYGSEGCITKDMRQIETSEMLFRYLQFSTPSGNIQEKTVLGTRDMGVQRSKLQIS